MKLKVTTFCTILLLLTSCSSKIELAKKSLVGEWRLTRLITTDLDSGDTYDALDVEGTFVFTPVTLSLDYTAEGNRLQEEFEYTLIESKENAGFTQVTRYDIDGARAFRVRFGDGTSDAHKDATKIVLESTDDGTFTQFDLMKI